MAFQKWNDLSTILPCFSRWRMPEFLTSNAVVDIARREADIGIRNRAHEQSWLAGRKTLPIAYAAFAARPEVRGYIVLPEGAASIPSDRWVRRSHSDEIATSASDSRLGADLAAQGMGRIVLPIFAGESMPGFEQIGAPIADLTHDEWLVAHQDARHDPSVRAGLDALAALLTDRALRPQG